MFTRSSGLPHRRCWRTATLGTVALVAGLSTLPATAQTTTQEPVTRLDHASMRWRMSWNLTLISTYDDNVFGLSPVQLDGLEAGRDRYVDMNAAHDIENSLRFRTRLRGPGLASQRLDLAATARLDLYTFSPRQSGLRFGLSARQRLSPRDRIRADISFAPREFRRNYLAGADEGGAPVYVAGTRQKVQGGLGYERTLWARTRGPELNTAARVLASALRFPDLPWRDRQELGGEIRTDLSVGAIEGELTAGRSRAFYAGLAEPVRLDDEVTATELARDFNLTRLRVAVGVQAIESANVGVRFEHRTREYLASLEEDPVFGDRRDRGATYGIELRLRAAPSVELRLGGDVQRQFTMRPGRGDTGDEASYSRRTATLRIDYDP